MEEMESEGEREGSDVHAVCEGEQQVRGFPQGPWGVYCERVQN